jgi:hypothetical protein
MAHPDCKYASLSDDGASSSVGDTLETLSSNHRAQKPRQRLRWAVILVFVEALHILLFYGIFSQGNRMTGCSNPGPNIDGRR